MNLTLDKQEILRYLGYRGQVLDSRTDGLLDQCIRQMLEGAKPRYTYRIFQVKQNIDDETIFLPECNLTLPGRDIYEHLRECRKCALMAATLGVEADNLIRVAETGEMSRAVVLDACATEMIEKVCDFVEQEIAAKAAEEGRGINSRFSPGYGDFPLEIQTQIGRILDAGRKIGLTVTPNALMLPRKSVTALIGFTIRPKKAASKCTLCSMRGRCKFRKEGTTCGR